MNKLGIQKVFEEQISSLFNIFFSFSCILHNMNHRFPYKAGEYQMDGLINKRPSNTGYKIPIWYDLKCV